VVEVDRPNRQTRHRKGKSDPVDALLQPGLRSPDQRPGRRSRGTGTWRRSGC
jgi:hypothetical protein